MIKYIREGFDLKKALPVIMRISAAAAAVLLAAAVCSAAAGTAEKLRQSSAYNSELCDKLEDSEKSLHGLRIQLEYEQRKNAELTGELAEAHKTPDNTVDAGNTQKSDPALPVGGNDAPTGEANEKICYLTFDDGPSANTPKILEILESCRATATFFVTGAEHPEYIKSISDSGNGVALHSYSHRYSEIYSDDAAYLSDLEKISELVEKQTGRKSLCIRFPGGSSNTVSLTQGKNPGIMTRLAERVTEMGYSYFDWNVSSEDAVGKQLSAYAIQNNVLRGASGKNRICVLMHDSTDRTTTVDALPRIIEGLRSMGYSFETLSPGCPEFHHRIGN